MVHVYQWSGSLSTVSKSNVEMLFFVNRGKLENPATNPWSRDEHQQETQPTYGINSAIPIRATLAGGERSHHCTIPAPQSRNAYLAPVHTHYIYLFLFIYTILYRVSILAEASLSRALIKIKGYTYITVKPDVLFHATLQTSAAMLVFLLAVCSERFATGSYNLLAKVANLVK